MKNNKTYQYENFCSECGVSVGIKRCRRHTCLCEKCRGIRRERRQFVIEATCRYCGEPVECKGKYPNYKSLTAGRNKRAYCSKLCRDNFIKWHSVNVAGPRIAELNRKYASDRMKKNNPMFKKESREKMSKTLKRIGHKPKIRGGNGMPLPVPQAILLAALGEGWEPECAVSLGHRTCGYPTNYKIDIGNRRLKVGIEVDGGSHCSLDRRRQDLKKTNKLSSLGWDIIRFKNEEVINDIGNVMSKIDAKVGV